MNTDHSSVTIHIGEDGDYGEAGYPVTFFSRQEGQEWLENNPSCSPWSLIYGILDDAAGDSAAKRLMVASAATTKEVIKARENYRTLTHKKFQIYYANRSFMRDLHSRGVVSEEVAEVERGLLKVAHEAFYKPLLEKMDIVCKPHEEKVRKNEIKVAIRALFQCQ